MSRINRKAQAGKNPVFLEIRVTTNAREPRVTRIHDRTYEVMVDERAERGRANGRLIELMSLHLGVPKSKLVLVKGARSRDKTIMSAP